MSQDPTLAEVILQGIRRELAKLHTHTPGRVESYDPSTRLASVKPLLRRLYDGADQAVDLPVINNVPILHPRTKNAQMTLPIAVGDTVLLLFCERSIDRWMELGGAIDPEDPAMHALNEAVAIPGLFPKNSPLAPNGENTSLEIANGKAWIEIKNDGSVLVSTSGKVTLSGSEVNLGDESGSALALKSDLALLTVTVPSGGGTLIPIISSACVGTIKTKAA